MTGQGHPANVAVALTWVLTATLIPLGCVSSAQAQVVPGPQAGFMAMPFPFPGYDNADTYLWNHPDASQADIDALINWGYQYGWGADFGTYQIVYDSALSKYNAIIDTNEMFPGYYPVVLAEYYADIVNFLAAKGFGEAIGEPGLPENPDEDNGGPDAIRSFFSFLGAMFDPSSTYGPGDAGRFLGDGINSILGPFAQFVDLLGIDLGPVGGILSMQDIAATVMDLGTHWAGFLNGDPLDATHVWIEMPQILFAGAGALLGEVPLLMPLSIGFEAIGNGLGGLDWLVTEIWG
ncbi:hypothetical protein AWC09_16575 [Mycolicibacter hiberniae]|nr:hypothetical protein AWC09_16575 [Mycolicibacter hiberniae]